MNGRTQTATSGAFTALNGAAGARILHRVIHQIQNRLLQRISITSSLYVLIVDDQMKFERFLFKRITQRSCSRADDRRERL